MKRGFTSQENKVVDFGWIVEQTQPLHQCGVGNRPAAMMDRIDVAKRAGQIAGRQNMEKDVALTGFELDGVRV